MDDSLSRVARLSAYLFAAIALLLLLPLLLLFVVGFYLLALFHAIRLCLAWLLDRWKPSTPAIQKPHFLGPQAPVKPTSENGSTPST
jgi:hypothetical protein